MKKIYDANSTKRLLENVFPADFKMVKNKLSNGYIFTNALYGVEDDSIRDYIDQAKHHISFEHFDYGLDYGYSQVKIPAVIHSGVVYGDGFPIKLTNEAEFMDGKPTRVIYNSGMIDLDQYSISGSGLTGLEYMRIDKTGSGVLLINTDINSTDAVIQDTYSTYKVDLSDLIETVAISGFNYGVQDQNYDNTNTYELLTPEISDVMIRKYPLTKYINLPKDGNSSNYNSKYLVDFYEPATYYWDSENKTYKPILPMRETYMEGTKELYYRVALNNPSGSGVYDTEYLELEHTPISGTIKLYDIDSLDDSGVPYEIQQGGTQLYKYDHYEDVKINISGTVDKDYSRIMYTYIGYTPEIPYEEGLNLIDPTVTAAPYKVTSWDYVREDDGLVAFVWTEFPTSEITNKIKIVNPTGRYFIEYKYAVDSQQNCITTMNSDRYVKYYDQDYIYASTDLKNNEIIIDSNLSVEKETRRAVSFRGDKVRPGSIIQKLELIGLITKQAATNTSNSVNVTDETLIGKEHTILPNIPTTEFVKFHHSYATPVFTPITGGVRPIPIGNSIGQRIKHDILGLKSSEYYSFYDADLKEDRIVRTRFAVKCVKNSSFDIIKSVTPDFSWKINIVNGKLFVQDSISQFSTSEVILVEDDIVELMVISVGSFNSKLQSQRFALLLSVNGSFFKYIHLYENPSVYYEELSVISDETTIYEGANIDLDYIKLYDRGTL